MAIPPDSNPKSQTPTPLTFPPQTFAKLSPHAYLSAHLNSPHGPHRPSDRTPTQWRPPTCHTGSLTHTNGSAVVRCGDTAVVCGVRVEVLRVDDVADYVPREVEGDDNGGDGGEEEMKRKRRRKEDAEEMARLNLLVPNIELATGCSPAHLPGGPPSLLAQTLTQRILTLLHTSHLLNMSDLRIWSQPPTPTPQINPTEQAAEEQELLKPEIKGFWTLYIDILFISLSGNPFDAAWLSLLAALSSVRLPRAWHDTDRDTILCSPLPSEATKLHLYDIPVALSFGVFFGEEEGRAGREKRKWVLVDVDGFEEGVCREGGTVVVGDKGRIVRVEVGGGGGVGREEVRGLVEMAGRRREEWIEVMGRGE